MGRKHKFVVLLMCWLAGACDELARVRAAGGVVASGGAAEGAAEPVPNANGVPTPSYSSQPPPGARVIYVSESTGNDQASGLGEDRAVRSIDRGMELLRKGFPDRLLLRRGDEFTGTIKLSAARIGGRSASEPMVIASYGPSKERPRIKAGTHDGLVATGGDEISHLVIAGLFFHAHVRDSDPRFKSEFVSITGAASGINWSAATRGLVIEDCMIKAFRNNIIMQPIGGDQKRIRNVRLIRNLVLDAYSDGHGHSQGGYFYYVQGLTLEGNLFDHNGWRHGGSGTIFNHNIYVKETNESVVLRGNIFARASSHGAQARSGGIVEGNLFLFNPIHLSFGHVNGSPVRADGVVGIISRNVFLGSAAIGSAERGSGVEIGNIRAASGVKVFDNIFSDDSGQRNGYAISLPEPHTLTNVSVYVGVNDLTIERNIVHDWQRAYGEDVSKSRNIVLRDNAFNTFSSNAMTNRDLTNYDGSRDAFLLRARDQSMLEYTPKYTAAEVIAYVREGFGRR